MRILVFLLSLVTTASFGQSFQMSFEAPIAFNLNLLPTAFEEGNFALYEVRSEGEEPYHHTIEIKEKGIKGNKECWHITITRDKPQGTTLSFWLPLKSQNLMDDAVEVTVLTAFGSFNINTLSGDSSEKLDGQPMDEKRVLLGKEQALKKLSLQRGEKEHRVWIKQGLGPLGIGFAEIWKGESMLSFELVEFGKR